MYKIDLESIQKLAKLSNLLNQLEVKGASNIEIMYNGLLLLQGVIQKLEEYNKTNEQPIRIDNTEGGK